MGKYLIMAAVVIAFIAGMFAYSYTGHFIGPGESASDFTTRNNFSGLKVVTRIIDGDTVVIEGESVRLLGMDADERGDPCYKAGKERLEELVLNKDVLLESDIENKDMYGRYLRYIFLNGTNINLRLVEEGLAIARFSPGNEKYKEEIVQAEKQARESKTGCKWENIE